MNRMTAGKSIGARKTNYNMLLEMGRELTPAAFGEVRKAILTPDAYDGKKLTKQEAEQAELFLERVLAFERRRGRKLSYEGSHWAAEDVYAHAAGIARILRRPARDVKELERRANVEDKRGTEDVNSLPYYDNRRLDFMGFVSDLERKRAD